MDLEDLRRRASAARKVLAQRDAAESRIAGERLHRALREASAPEGARSFVRTVRSAWSRTGPSLWTRSLDRLHSCFRRPYSRP
jgi:hypothetical protein